VEIRILEFVLTDKQANAQTDISENNTTFAVRAVTRKRKLNRTE